MSQAPMPPPNGWGHDDLTTFLDRARQNTYATFANLQGSFQKVREIDRTFKKSAEHLDNTVKLVEGLLLQRSHAAFRSAISLAMSGQLPEAHMVLRGCLENALYAQFIDDDATRAEIWLRRHDDDASLLKVKKVFKVTAMLDLLETKDSQTGRAIKQLYARTVDYGGHPNEKALSSTTAVKDHDGTKRFEVSHLEANPQKIDLCLRTAAQIGVGSLRIFKLIFQQRFDIVGVSDEIAALSQGL